MPSYLDNCKAIASSLDAEEISSRTPGELVGVAGSGYSFRPLGKLSMFDLAVEHIGVKIPRLSERSVESRVHFDLAFISLQTAVTPELAPYFPQFMNLVRVDGTDTLAVLMEDVSEGGQNEVLSGPASPEVREMLYRPYADLGDISEVLDRQALNRTTSFDVGDQEKLLDLVPAPIHLKYLRSPSSWDVYSGAVWEALTQLTITVPAESSLGNFLLNPGPENY